METSSPAAVPQAPGRDQAGMFLPSAFTIPRFAALTIGALETFVIAGAIVLAVLTPAQRRGKRNLPAR